MSKSQVQTRRVVCDLNHIIPESQLRGPGPQISTGSKFINYYDSKENQTPSLQYILLTFTSPQFRLTIPKVLALNLLQLNLVLFASLSFILPTILK